MSCPQWISAGSAESPSNNGCGAVDCDRVTLEDEPDVREWIAFGQYWIAKVFRAQAATGPKVVVSNQESGELVGVMDGAIALVDSADVPAGLKVLPIDGLRPGDGNYPLSYADDE